jgi:hypothetical protein
METWTIKMYRRLQEYLHTLSPVFQQNNKLPTLFKLSQVLDQQGNKACANFKLTNLLSYIQKFAMVKHKNICTEKSKSLCH